MPSHLTIRKLPPEVARGLDEERRRRGVSLDQTVIDLLRRALGVHRDRPHGNGLERLPGSWSEDELQAFERASVLTFDAHFERIARIATRRLGPSP